MSNGRAAAMELSHGKSREAKGDASGRAGSLQPSRRVKPLISLVAVFAISAVLVATIFLTNLSAEWITFLAGVLVAALLAEATRLSRAEWALMRRTAQLSSTKSKLEREVRAHRIAEQALAASLPRLHLMDDVLSSMVVFVDADVRCHYHNHALREWLHLRPQQIEGRHLNEVFGPKVFQEIAAHVRSALDGHGVKYERTNTTPDGTAHQLAVTHVPQYGEGGKVTGFYMVTDVVSATPPAAVAPHLHAQGAPAHAAPAASAAPVEDDAGAEIVRAIERNEFRLFSQRIAPLGETSGHAEYHEILVRLMEEEEGLIPPGAFFPLAEKYGLMPHLDRWVVRHVAEWIAMQFQQNIWPDGSVYFINLSDDSIADPGFTDFVEVTLAEYGVPAAAMCFEVSNTELVAGAPAVADFAKRVHDCGARIALSGFGRNGAGFDKILGFTPDYLKLDGAMLLSIAGDVEARAQVKAISDTAHKVGARTIGEMVESADVLASLGEIGVDLAQGFGIARPHPLARKADERPASAPQPGVQTFATRH